MKKLLAAAGIVAVGYALILFLTGSVGAISVTLAPGMNDVACPQGHRAQAAYTLDRSGLRVNCVSVVTPTATPASAETQTPTRTPIPPTPAPTQPLSTHPNCQNKPPLGGIEPQRPEWCFLPQQPEITTHVNGPNSWADDFNHGQLHARLGNVGDGYVVDSVGEACEELGFRHNNHWMINTIVNTGQFPTLCAHWLRPDRTFALNNGRLVIEMEVAVPIAGTRGTSLIDDSWPELVISTASRPTTAQENSWFSPFRKNGTYLYEAFPRSWTFGCRMQQSRHPICALYNDGESFAGSTDRQWEVNQNGGDVRFQFGGDPAAVSNPAVWKQCNSVDDPDTVCRNLFRFEFYKDGAGLYVLDIYSNGVLYYRAGLEDNQLDNIFSRPFYVYFGEFLYRVVDDVVLVSHWDHISINP